MNDTDDVADLIVEAVIADTDRDAVARSMEPSLGESERLPFRVVVRTQEVSRDCRHNAMAPKCSSPDSSLV